MEELDEDLFGVSKVKVRKTRKAEKQRRERLHSKNEGMKHIPTQYDSHTFSFHTMDTKEAFILL